MKSAAALVVASAALASAQATFNQTTGKYNCALPNVAYCAGDSLQTDIIIRCDQNGVGQPGRCSDNLDGEPPVGDFTALCWTSSSTAGDAACEKNCVVYGGSGNYPGDFTLPASVCVPTYTAPGSSATGSGTVYPVYPSGSPTTTPPASGTGSGTVYPGYPSGSPTTTPPASGTGSGTTCPPTMVTSTTYSTYVPPPISTGTGTGGSAPSGNGTYSATNAPTTVTTPKPVSTAGASANGVTGALVILGLVAAYVL